MKKKSTHKQSQTDWDRVDRMQDHEIDVSETPEISPEKFAQAIVRKGLKPVQPKESDSGPWAPVIRAK
jgi:hypothetical protein